MLAPKGTRGVNTILIPSEKELLLFRITIDEVQRCSKWSARKFVGSTGAESFLLVVVFGSVLNVSS